MLQTIKNCIINLPQESFGAFYQRYVASCEDSIVDSDVRAVESEISSLCKIPELITSINELTDSLHHA